MFIYLEVKCVMQRLTIHVKYYTNVLLCLVFIYRTLESTLFEASTCISFQADNSFAPKNNSSQSTHGAVSNYSAPLTSTVSTYSFR